MRLIKPFLEGKALITNEQKFGLQSFFKLNHPKVSIRILYLAASEAAAQGSS